LDGTLSEKIRNYFSERIEEIKKGIFVPSYEQIKDLPEFSGINRDAFIIARNEWFKQTFHMNPNKWYKQNFHMNLTEFSSRLADSLSEKGNEKIRNYFSDRIEEIKKRTFIPSYDKIKDLPEFSGITRDAFIIVRNGWYKQNFHMNFYEFKSYLASGLSEEEYVLKLRRKRMDKEIDIKRIKGKSNIGLCCLIPGVLCIFNILLFIPNYSFGAIAWVAGIPFGIILMVIGLVLILYYRSKLP